MRLSAFVWFVAGWLIFVSVPFAHGVWGGGFLASAGVLYAPDYVVNAGGVINIAEELVGYHRERAYANVRRIYDTTLSVIDAAARECITTAAAADRLAESRIASVGRVLWRAR